MMAEIGFVVTETPGQPVDDLLEALRLYEPRADVVQTEGSGGMAKNIGVAGTAARIIGFVRSGTTLKRGISVRVRNHFNASPQLGALVSEGALFVRRDVFVRLGRFEESLDAGWEDEDLLRRAEEAGVPVQRVDLPTTYTVATIDSKEDRTSYRHHDNRSSRLLQERWGDESVSRRLPPVAEVPSDQK